MKLTQIFIELLFYILNIHLFDQHICFEHLFYVGYPIRCWDYNNEKTELTLAKWYIQSSRNKIQFLVSILRGVWNYYFITKLNCSLLICELLLSFFFFSWISENLYEIIIPNFPISPSWVSRGFNWIVNPLQCVLVCICDFKQERCSPYIAVFFRVESQRITWRKKKIWQSLDSRNAHIFIRVTKFQYKIEFIHFLTTAFSRA